MHILAKVVNARHTHSAVVATDGKVQALALLDETDRVAEIQSTVRHGCPIVFERLT